MFICLYNRYETLYSLKVLLAVLIIFLIIGSLTRKALIKIIDMSKGDENNIENNADNKTGEEDKGNEENSGNNII